MKQVRFARRDFLKKASTGLLAAPVLSSLGLLVEGQSSSKSTGKTTTANALAKPKVILNIREFGATGDGKTKDTVAIQEAINRCSVLGGGEIFVPAGDYLIGAIALRSDTLLRLDAGSTLLGTPDFDDYPVAQVRWEGKWIQGRVALVYAIDAKNIAVVGGGKIVGNDTLGGRPNAANPLRHPALMEFIRCENIRLEDFSTRYHLMWSIHPTCSNNIVIKNLTIRSTGGNGDGIDIDSCKHVQIDRCDISTGDDCISLKSGRGAEAFAMLETTEDVQITNCTFADSIFACIGIGSETSGGIRNVRIEHCKFALAKTFAVYIKSRPGRGAFIEDIVGDDFDVSGTTGGFLRLNILNSGLQDQVPVPGDIGIPTIRNFRFSNVRVNNVPMLVDGMAIHPKKPLEGFSLTNVSGTCEKGIFLANVRRAELRDIKVTGFSGALINTVNVTGTGLAGAATLEPTVVPEPIVAPAQSYQLR